MDLKNFLLDGRLKLIFQNSPSGVLIIDKTGTVLLFNAAAERISSLKASKFIGWHLTELNLPVGLLDVLKTGQSDISRRHQYNHVTFITNRSPIKDDRGNVIGAISMFQDISEFEHLSEELKMSKESLAQLQTVLEASYDGFLITDQEGVVLQANSAVQRLFGLPAGCINGKDCPGPYIDDHRQPGP
ncbi:MAG: PAS domain-containing protein [Clostridia bacterium]|nr:PAS domain-containing protein [Clostridia bacterium]